MINSRSLDELTPDTKAKAEAFKRGCKAEGVDVLITSTYRDSECQASLYAQGRTTPGAIVTKATPGHSFHNYRVAFDFVPLLDGKAIWANHDTWEICGKVAESVGLDWGGNWEFKDKPHCQNTQGQSITALLAGGVHLA